MGMLQLELRCSQSLNGVAVNPDPDWSFGSLLSELDALEKKINDSSNGSTRFIKSRSPECPGKKSVERNPRTFVMRVDDEDFEDVDGDLEEVKSGALVSRGRFDCRDVYLSDESDDEVAFEEQPFLMDEGGLVEGALFELAHDYQLRLKDEIRNQISAIEADMLNEREKSESALVRVEKYKDARRDMDRRIDTQYQRKIAEALENHLTAIQRDHEQRSQIEERKIRNDAAYEEAKRREKALKEEKLREERAKAEAEAARRKVEDQKRAALEAERKAKEAAEKEAAENLKKMSSLVSQNEAPGQKVDGHIGNLISQPQPSDLDGKKTAESAVKGAQTALALEQERLQKLRQIEERNLALKVNANKDFGSIEKRVARLMRQIGGSEDSVRSKAAEFLKILKDPGCPQTISVATFANKIVSRRVSPDLSAAFACAHFIVLVTSQVPYIMDIILAEFHTACIFTVPKYITYSKSVFESKEAHYRALGFKEVDGKLEDVNDYLTRLKSYMKLYGAIVQTEVVGVQKAHGLVEGWAWLARFLNTLPANIFTAVALNEFLRIAGFALFRRYKFQFMKLLNIVYEDYLPALAAREDSDLSKVISEIRSYIEDREFLQEPEGRVLRSEVDSRKMGAYEGDYY